jgi:hypothetical protein
MSEKSSSALPSKRWGPIHIVVDDQGSRYVVHRSLMFPLTRRERSLGLRETLSAESEEDLLRKMERQDAVADALAMEDR